MDLLWIGWTVVAMLLSWQNSVNTGVWNPPITYLWTLTDEKAMFSSWLPIGYLSAWIINPFIFLIEIFAWWAGGEFLIIWASFGLWGGFLVAAFPWIAELIYILSEYPGKYVGARWQFIFWSAEFWMLFMQGSLWFLSFIIHAAALPSVIRMVRAR